MIVLLTALAAPLAPAQEVQLPPPPAQPTAPVAGPDDPDAIELEEIVVVGGRLRGSVDSDVEPEETLDARDIRAYGATDISELLDALAIQTSSARGRSGGQPVVLINGKRISSFREVRSIPTEAISRVEILPEEVALDYGYRADQRVVNIVLRERFRAVTTNTALSASTLGDRYTPAVDGSILRIRGDDRWTVDGELTGATRIRESDRDIVRDDLLPFDIDGNITALVPGEEIDPALTAAAGVAATIVGAPPGGGTLADYAARADTPNARNDQAYRTLSPETVGASLNAVLTRSLASGISATANVGLDMDQSLAWLGLPEGDLILPAETGAYPFSQDVRLFRYFPADGPLERQSRTFAGHFGATLSGERADWRWTFTGNADLSRNETTTDRDADALQLQAAVDAGFNPLTSSGLPAGAPLRRDRTETTTTNLDAQLLLNGSPFTLPAGALRTTFKVGLDADRIDSASRAIEGDTARDLDRLAGVLQSSVTVPLVDGEGALGAIGDLSLNFNLELERLSDFGGLTTYGYGLRWKPTDKLNLIASVTEEEGAPTIQQLGDPLTVTPNVDLYDFATGETVIVERIDGGAADLKSDSRQVVKLGLTFKPWTAQDFNLSANYVRSRSRDPISSFPAYSAGIEEAFPERFVRDTDGRLVSVDFRPVNFESAARDELRWGFTYSKAIGRRPEGGGGPLAQAGLGRGPRPGDAEAGGPPTGLSGPDGAPAVDAVPAAATEGRPAGGEGQGPGGGRGFGEGGFGGGPGGGMGGRAGGGMGGGMGRFQFALFHTYRFRDEIVIREGLPVLDLLNGASEGRSGGKPVNGVEANLGYSLAGYGAQLKANWAEGTRVAGEATDGSEDLFFPDRTDVALKLFIDFSARRELVSKLPFLRRSRLSLDVDNLFDERTEAVTPEGEVLPTYQRDLVDPVGRTVKLTFRKQF